MTQTYRRKLIEVALPLEAINRESAREKSIRHGHPSTLHLWWARRPLAAARAILFAQLVDDPSARPEEFPTEELQRKERERLHRLIERLVVWENVRDEKLLGEAHAEILKSTDGNPPPILDPFAGGGTIPLEAQRLGLEAHSSDLNPVAVLINKALIEIPSTFRDQPPVLPGLAVSEIRSWRGAEGLAADVRGYGEWMRDEAQKRIGHLYPKATLPDGSKATVIAWIWARMVTCPNPACGIEMPLVRNWWLGKKKGKEAYIIPSIVEDASKRSRRRIAFEIVSNGGTPPQRVYEGTVGRTGATCLSCESSVPLAYIREEGRAKRITSQLMAVAAEGRRRRIYLSPSDDHVSVATVEAPVETVVGSLGYYPRDLKAPTYGLTEFTDLFTNRQLVSLTELSDLVTEARERVLAHGASRDYADAVATYLGIGVSRYANFSNALCQWRPDAGKEQVGHLFVRQAIPMVWDFAEANPFSNSAGGWIPTLTFIPKALEHLPMGPKGCVKQADASSRAYAGELVSTDPPYYDNIGYSDLSDFFYVWLRRTLRHEYPGLLSTMLVPKKEELVANPYRHGGAEGAKDFFETGFGRVFAHIRESALDGFPITVYYAFKQSENDGSGESSTGWETLLEGMIRAGWEITSTWPVRSELGNRMMASGMNALASSIVLSLRPRPAVSPTTDRRGFIAALEAELPTALRKLQQGQVAPVDLPQAAIGPGMAVFSRYGAVLEPDGSKMTVRSALARINEILDQVLNEQEGDFDSTSRFALGWYRQNGYGVGRFGDADNLARARNTSVDVMDRGGIVMSRGGNVQLIKPADLCGQYDVVADLHTSNWEVLHHLIKALEQDGIVSAGELLRAALSRSDDAIDPDLLKELAHLLFRIAESNGWTKDALSFNNLVTSWPEILDVARNVTEGTAGVQGAMDFAEGDD
jgi:putative DNA methylase